MNNLVHSKQSDPIFDEFKAFVDKDAGMKTIAFKYFGADLQRASEYLSIFIGETTQKIMEEAIPVMQPVEYYQPELIH